MPAIFDLKAVIPNAIVEETNQPPVLASPPGLQNNGPPRIQSPLEAKLWFPRVRTPPRLL